MDFPSEERKRHPSMFVRGVYWFTCGSVHAVALTSVSPLRMLTAGVRSCRRGHHVAPAGHALPTLHLQRTSGHLLTIQRIYTGSASTIFPLCTGWQHASCLDAASDARGSDTLLGTTSGDGRCLLLAPAHLRPPKATHDDLTGSIPRAPVCLLNTLPRVTVTPRTLRATC